MKSAAEKSKSSVKSSAKSNSRGAWIDEVYAAVGRPVRLETRDGVQRAARMSGLRAQEIVYNGVKRDFVTEIELNGDPSDTVPLGSLVRFQID